MWLNERFGVVFVASMFRPLQGFFGSMALLAPRAGKLRASVVAKRMASHRDGLCQQQTACSSQARVLQLRQRLPEQFLLVLTKSEIAETAAARRRPVHASESCFVKA